MAQVCAEPAEIALYVPVGALVRSFALSPQQAMESSVPMAQVWSEPAAMLWYEPEGAPSLTVSTVSPAG